MLTKTINGIKYWSQLFLLPIYWLSFIFPRNKNIWLFGSTFGRRFADNPRYLYLYMNQFKDEVAETNSGNVIRAIWISRNRDIVKHLNEQGYEGYYYHSLKGIWFCLRGKVYIFDNYSKDISFWLSAGAKKINLWHGTGNKRINYDNRFDKVRHPKNLWEKFKYFPRRLSDEKPSHYILATSDKMGRIFSSAFKVDMSHIIVDGYPRNDVLLTDCGIDKLCTHAETEVTEDIIRKKEQGNKIIIYMPTFRDSEEKFFDAMDMKVFNEFLRDNDYMFYTKLHPKSKLQSKFMEIKCSNIYNIASDVDTYTILGIADMLVTDYSSVHTDFALLNKPTVIFLYDLEEYSANTRDCYFDYDEYMPELKCYSMEELMTDINKAFSYDGVQDKRKRLVDTMWKYKDSKSCMRITEKIINILK